MRAKDQTHTIDITTGALPGSRKIYVAGDLHPEIRVGMRQIDLSPTIDEDGTEIANEPVVVYDTSGPYTDPDYHVDLQRGLPRLREAWIEGRGDTHRLEELSSEYGRQRRADERLDHLRFAHLEEHPRVASGTPVTQLYYARQGIITPEMEYVAIRENQLVDKIREAYRREHGERWGG